MRTADSEKIDLQALLREEVYLDEDTVTDAQSDPEEAEQKELASLNEQHENLRRQVALLREKISVRHVNTSHGIHAHLKREPPVSPAILVGLLGISAIAIYSLRNR
ncbi:hypothetical protein HA459_00555 [Rhizobium leguminosarum bv. trifolii]|uniref:hypothetical protein n=1 Tax=Rhizobium leguminosarum TaxID=384 RepID=UPI00140FBB31|nr:hypothetical protein [Rhizobium leguminosarum]QIO70597.1 hypothetical protein HA459_00555 [Rhizobium leguminosarum bv. trifolii]QIO77602.1 hypothetical protein HA460_00550 [Rhizobium leguminosarum bv. trifolii]